MIYMRPVIKGSFYNKQWNPEINSVYVAMNQGAELREAISQTSVEFPGVQSDPIEIYSIANMNSPNQEGVIEKGKNIEIKGAYIRVAGDNPKCGIDFRNTTSNEVFRLPISNIVLNEPSRLMLLIPVEMENGEYRIHPPRAIAHARPKTHPPQPARKRGVVPALSAHRPVPPTHPYCKDGMER